MGKTAECSPHCNNSLNTIAATANFLPTCFVLVVGGGYSVLHINLTYIPTNLLAFEAHKKKKKKPRYIYVFSFTVLGYYSQKSHVLCQLSRGPRPAC